MRQTILQVALVISLGNYSYKFVQIELEKWNFAIFVHFRPFWPFLGAQNV
jgi:hypothetical protein